MKKMQHLQSGLQCFPHFYLYSLQLIFSGEYTKAMDKDWHSGHFCCWQCDESLTGQRYVIRDDHPYCIKCYENVFANTCEECNKIIGIDSKVSKFDLKQLKLIHLHTLWRTHVCTHAHQFLVYFQCFISNGIFKWEQFHPKRATTNNNKKNK